MKVAEEYAVVETEQQLQTYGISYGALDLKKCFLFWGGSSLTALYTAVTEIDVTNEEKNPCPKSKLEINMKEKSKGTDTHAVWQVS